MKPFELDWIHGGRAFDVFLRRNLVTGATTVLRRSLLAHAAPFPVEWLHDEWLAIIAAAIGRVDVLEDELIDYRQHESNQIGAQRDTFVRKVRRRSARGATRTSSARSRRSFFLRACLRLATGRRRHDRKVRDKLEHQRFRAALPRARIARACRCFARL